MPCSAVGPFFSRLGFPAVPLNAGRRAELKNGLDAVVGHVGTHLSGEDGEWDEPVPSCCFSFQKLVLPSSFACREIFQRFHGSVHGNCYSLTDQDAHQDESSLIGSTRTPPY